MLIRVRVLDRITLHPFVCVRLGSVGKVTFCLQHYRQQNRDQKMSEQTKQRHPAHRHVREQQHRFEDLFLVVRAGLAVLGGRPQKTKKEEEESSAGLAVMGGRPQQNKKVGCRSAVRFRPAAHLFAVVADQPKLG